MSLVQVAQILSTWPGDLVYHLLVLFVIQAMVGLAWMYRRGPLRPFTQRVWRAGLGLGLGRISLILAAGMAQQINLSAAAILPFLERCVDVVGLGWLAWSFVPAWGRNLWSARVLCLANPALALIIYALLAPGWYSDASRGVALSGSPQDILWGAWGLALAMLGLVGAGLDWRRGAAGGAAWGQTLAAFIFICLGYLFHVLLPDPSLSITGWTRLAFAVAYPLLLVSLFYQCAAPAQTAGGADSLAEVWRLEDALRALRESPDRASWTGYLEKAAIHLAPLVGARAAAIGIPGASPDVVELAAIHSPGSPPPPGRVFQLDTQPAIKRAIAHKQGLALGAPGAEASSLFAMLGHPTLGPVWIEPIIHNRQALGVLIVGKDKQAAPWSAGEIQNVQAHVARLGSALGLSRRLQEAARRDLELSRRANDLESQLAQANASNAALVASLRAELEQARSELALAHQQLAQHRKRLDDLAALVQLQAGQTPGSEALAPRAEQLHEVIP